MLPEIGLSKVPSFDVFAIQTENIFLSNLFKLFGCISAVFYSPGSSRVRFFLVEKYLFVLEKYLLDYQTFSTVFLTCMRNRHIFYPKRFQSGNFGVAISSFNTLNEF